MISEICCAIIGIHLGTAHIDNDRPLNDYNPGIYVQTTNNIVVGTYYNSIKRQSVYVGYNYSIGPVDVLVGAVTGYYRPVLPMVMPSVKVGPVRMGFLPKTEITSAHIVHFSIEKEFK